MKIIRPVEVVTCCICGEEFDKINTKEIFTGRVKYMCFHCEAMSNKELAAAKTTWRKTEAGKRTLEELNKHKRR